MSDTPGCERTGSVGAVGREAEPCREPREAVLESGVPEGKVVLARTFDKAGSDLRGGESGGKTSGRVPGASVAEANLEPDGRGGKVVMGDEG